MIGEDEAEEAAAAGATAGAAARPSAKAAARAAKRRPTAAHASAPPRIETVSLHITSAPVGRGGADEVQGAGADANQPALQGRQHLRADVHQAGIRAGDQQRDHRRNNAKDRKVAVVLKKNRAPARRTERLPHASMSGWPRCSAWCSAAWRRGAAASVGPRRPASPADRAAAPPASRGPRRPPPTDAGACGRWRARVARTPGAALKAARRWTRRRGRATVSFPSVEMLIEDADRRAHDITVAGARLGFVRRQLETARAYADGWRPARIPYRARHRHDRQGVPRDWDGTLQPYALYVPRGDAAGGGLAAGGRAARRLLRPPPEPAPRVRPRQPPRRDPTPRRRATSCRCRTCRCIVVSPFGRGELDGLSTAWASEDVLRVMADVRRAYAVDPDGIRLTGLSMGGEGTWHIGLRHPDLFAALTPVCGIADAATGHPGADARALRSGAAGAVERRWRSPRTRATCGSPSSTATSIRRCRSPTRARWPSAIASSAGWARTSATTSCPKRGPLRLGGQLSRRQALTSWWRREARSVSAPRDYKTLSLRYNKAYWLRIDGDRARPGAGRDRRRAGDGDEIRRASRKRQRVLAAAGSQGVRRRSRSPSSPAGRSIYQGPPRPVLGFARAAGGSWKAVEAGGPATSARRRCRTTGRAVSSAARSRASGRTFTSTARAGRPEVTAANRTLARAMGDWGHGVRAQFAVKADSEVTPAEHCQPGPGSGRQRAQQHDRAAPGPVAAHRGPRRPADRGLAGADRRRSRLPPRLPEPAVTGPQRVDLRRRHRARAGGVPEFCEGERGVVGSRVEPGLHRVRRRGEDPSVGGVQGSVRDRKVASRFDQISAFSAAINRSLSSALPTVMRSRSRSSGVPHHRTSSPCALSAR